MDNAIKSLKRLAVDTGRQLFYVVRKSLTLQRRYWKSSLAQAILAPLICLLLLFGIQEAVNGLFTPKNIRPAATPLKSVPPCQPGFRTGKPCITVMYAPQNDLTDRVMSSFVALNELRRPASLAPIKLDNGAWTPALNTLPGRNLGAVAVPNADFIYSFTDQNPNVTAWGVVFNQYPSVADPAITNIEYELWYNFTDTARKFRVSGAPAFVIGSKEPFNDDFVAMFRALDEAILSATSASDNKEPLLDIDMKAFPELPDSAAARCRNPDDAFRQLGGVFLLIPMTVIFFNLVNTIVTEKEKYLKDAMQMVGLKPFVFWFGHLVSVFGLVLVNALVTCITGFALGFSLFKKADFGLLLLFFILLGLAWVGFALALSSMTSRVKVGIGLGFFIVIVSVIYCGVGPFVATIWYTDSGTDLNPGWIVLMFFPFFNYNKFLQDALLYTSSTVPKSSTSCSIQEGRSFGYSDLDTQISTNPLSPAPGQSLGLLFMNLCLWFLVAMYLDKVVPNDNGYSEHPLFFLVPSYWGFQDPKWMRSSKNSGSIPAASQPAGNEDEDIVAERKETKSFLPESDGAPNGLQNGLIISGLNKRYDGGLKSIVAWIYRQLGVSEEYLEQLPSVLGQSKTAVHELSLNIGQGNMLALLGSNGAGKTSTMKIMYGVSPPTAGYLSIFGMDVRSQMSEIRKRLGVCQQFDILFPDLSAKEHIELFCGIKGLLGAEIQSVAESRLKHMKLWKVRDQRSGEYSGGMKRRLSVILATLGDPDCVFLDEPTTGMDPVNKRYVWSFLEEFKKGRVIVLTTHSMEEADILADKIAIMSQGRLKAVGNSVHLKNKFGTGYRISMIVLRGDQVATIKQRIEAVCPGVTVEEEEYIGSSANDDETVRAGQTCRLVYAANTMDSVKKIVGFLETASAPAAVETDEYMKGAIVSFGMSQATLEDVFLSVVKE